MSEHCAHSPRTYPRVPDEPALSVPLKRARLHLSALVLLRDERRKHYEREEYAGNLSSYDLAGLCDAWSDADRAVKEFEPQLLAAEKRWIEERAAWQKRVHDLNDRLAGNVAPQAA